MPSYVYDSDTRKLVDKGAYYADKARKALAKMSALPMPYVASDIKPYQSPITGKLIESRSARREDLARSGCREVDPSERPVFRNYEFCQKHRRPYLGGEVPPPMSKNEKAEAKWRKAQEKKAEGAREATLKAKAAKNRDPVARHVAGHDAPMFRGHAKKAPLFHVSGMPK